MNDASADATDAALPLDAGSDAAFDASDASDGSTCATLLVGNIDATTQGWSIQTQGGATVTYGADYVRLATTTSGGATTSGQLLLYRPSTVTAGTPFKLQVVMQVESVNAHNTLDSAAAILGSFIAPAGSGTDRAQMVYLDSAKVGWSDDSQSAVFNNTDGAYHTYQLALDAANQATLSVDDVPKLVRAGFAVNGTIAIGDQTNDPNVDSAVRIKSVRLCP